jgi:choline dehydrogenase
MISGMVADCDFVVVGGGSSGCVVAAKLSRRGHRVLLLEEGPRDKNPLLRITAGFIKVLESDKYLLFHFADSDVETGRRQRLPQARVLGGGSTVNAMVYQRGRSTDWDQFASLTGNPLWCWESMLRYFIGQEGNQKLANRFHGTDGPLWVSDPGYICDTSYAFVRAAQAHGLPFNSDFNDGNPHGVGFMQYTNRQGLRCSARSAFLQPAEREPGLSVLVNAKVESLVLNGREVIGVNYQHKGTRRTIYPQREVILTAGAIGTPRLLMASGIGDAEHLKSVDVNVVSHIPGVGENLVDHCEVSVVASTNVDSGYHHQDVGLKMIRNGLEYLLFRRGRVTTTGVEACAYVVPEHGTGDGVIKMYCVPTTAYRDPDVTFEDRPGISLNACLLRPKSRGSVRLRSRDPAAPIVLKTNYLSDPLDMEHMIAGIKSARELLQCAPLSKMIVQEMSPGPARQSDAELASYARRVVKTNYHPVGTCKAGDDSDELAVVDAKFSVRGLDRLRVMDLSTLPDIISGNTNAAAMAVASMAVDAAFGEVQDA